MGNLNDFQREIKMPLHVEVPTLTFVPDGTDETDFKLVATSDETDKSLAQRMRDERRELFKNQVALQRRNQREMQMALINNEQAECRRACRSLRHSIENLRDHLSRHRNQLEIIANRLPKLRKVFARSRRSRHVAIRYKIISRLKKILARTNKRQKLAAEDVRHKVDNLAARFPKLKKNIKYLFLKKSIDDAYIAEMKRTIPKMRVVIAGL